MSMTETGWVEPRSETRRNRPSPDSAVSLPEFEIGIDWFLTPAPGRGRQVDHPDSESGISDESERLGVVDRAIPDEVRVVRQRQGADDGVGVRVEDQHAFRRVVADHAEGLGPDGREGGECTQNDEYAGKPQSTCHEIPPPELKCLPELSPWDVHRGKRVLTASNRARPLASVRVLPTSRRRALAGGAGRRKRLGGGQSPAVRRPAARRPTVRYVSSSTPKLESQRTTPPRAASSGAGGSHATSSAIASSSHDLRLSMALGRALSVGRGLVGGGSLTAVADHFDLAGLDQLLEGGALQRVVLHLTATGRADAQRLAARQRDLDRFARLVDDGSDDGIS